MKRMHAPRICMFILFVSHSFCSHVLLDFDSITDIVHIVRMLCRATYSLSLIE